MEYVWLAVALIIGVPLAIVALRVKFDINKWQDRNQENRLLKLRQLCTHTLFDYNSQDDSVQVRSMFSSPSGTVEWICRRCGLQVFDSSYPEEIMNMWAKDIGAWHKREEQFSKLYDKLYK